MAAVRELVLLLGLLDLPFATESAESMATRETRCLIRSAAGGRRDGEEYVLLFVQVRSRRKLAVRFGDGQDGQNWRGRREREQ